MCLPWSADFCAALLRYLDSATAAWLTLDPYRGDGVNPASLMRYQFAGNNPVTVYEVDGYYGAQPALMNGGYGGGTPAPPGPPVSGGGRVNPPARSAGLGEVVAGGEDGFDEGAWAREQQRQSRMRHTRPVANTCAIALGRGGDPGACANVPVLGSTVVLPPLPWWVPAMGGGAQLLPALVLAAPYIAAGTLAVGAMAAGLYGFAMGTWEMPAYSISDYTPGAIQTTYPLPGTGTISVPPVLEARGNPKPWVNPLYCLPGIETKRG